MLEHLGKKGHTSIPAAYSSSKMQGVDIVNSKDSTEMIS